MVHAVSPIIMLVSGLDIKELQYIKHSKKAMIAVGQQEYTAVWVPIIDSGASDDSFVPQPSWNGLMEITACRTLNDIFKVPI
jgi:predicted alpha/beta hydrolase